MANAIFPTKIKGNYLDTLARMSLWEVGLDYSHGTGHGVGAYLNVHEGKDKCFHLETHKILFGHTIYVSFII